MAAICVGTRESIQSVESIRSVIIQICADQSAIASAVEEQNATAREIGWNLQDISQASQSLLTHIEVVSGSSSRTNDRVLESTRLIAEISDASEQVAKLVGISAGTELTETADHHVMAGGV